MTETPHGSSESLLLIQQFIEKARMESAYQMLLLLMLFSQADEHGNFSLDEAVFHLALFYQRRRQQGLSEEKQRSTNPRSFTAARLRTTLPKMPYPRLARAGLLDFDPERRTFTVPPMVWSALQMDPEAVTSLRGLAVARLASHYSESKQTIDELVKQSIEVRRNMLT